MVVGSGQVGGVVSPGEPDRPEDVPGTNDFAEGFDRLFATRQEEADEFYASRVPKDLSDDAKAVMRQAFGGMLWCKQFYHYDVHTWLEGDPAGPPRRRSAGTAATRIGRTYTTKTSFPCRTIGNIPGTPPGTWRFTASRWRWWIRFR